MSRTRGKASSNTSVENGRLKNVNPLLNGVGALFTKDMEKAELLNDFFASVFTAKISPQVTRTLEVREEIQRKEAFPLVEGDRVRDHLSKVNTHKAMGPAGIHPQVLKELAGVIVTPLSIIFERS